MPAADINHVSVTFENGLKREECGPTRKASVTISAAVDKGEDGVVAMNYIGTLARAKVADLLGQTLPAEAAAAISAEAAPVGETEAPKRTRRTKEQIAADAAASAATGAASEPSAPTASGEQTASEDWSEPGEQSQTTSSDSQGSGADDWSEETPAAEAPAPITDADLAMHCSKHAQRLGGGEKVKGAIAGFKPNGWDKPKFGVTDILPSQRPNFVEKLEAL